jgi:hypothetical protein
MFYVWQRLLSSGTLTTDPAKADFFFLPVSNQWIFSTPFWMID